MRLEGGGGGGRGQAGSEVREPGEWGRAGRWPQMEGREKIQQFSKPSLGGRGGGRESKVSARLSTLGEITQEQDRAGEGLSPT